MRNTILNCVSVTPHYLRAIGTPLKAGRDFTEQDDGDAPQMAMIRREVAAVDPEQAVMGVMTMEQRVSTTLARPRFIALLLNLLSALAAALAAVGIYGVISYSVAQRTREIGIRLALGAKRNDVLRLVIRQGMALAGAGVAIGLAASLALTRLMQSLLYGVSATDLLT